MSNLNFNAASVTPHEGFGDVLSEPRDATRRWSEYQMSIFSFVESGRGNAIVEAVAGSGKSTTIVEAMKLVRGSSLFLAFNKSIADELKRKGVNARTFHSLCFSAVLNALRVDGPTSDKMRKLVKEFTNLDGDVIEDTPLGPVVHTRFTPLEARMYGPFAIRLVGLAKQQGMGFLTPDEFENWKAICDHHDIAPEHEDADVGTGIKFARELLKWSNADPRIDFDDMLYVAVRDRLSLPKFDFIFVDEAQDTNMIQREILRMIMRPDSRMIAVGDPSQAIYGFRGADARSLRLIADEFNAVTLPLSISYRCSQRVVSYARQWVDHIEAADNAPEGEVNSFGTDWSTLDFRPNDLVVCRTTAPLISLAFRCIRNNVPVQVMGRDIGQGLKVLISKMNAHDLPTLREKLMRFMQREMAAALADDEEEKAAAISDKVMSIISLIDALNEDNRTLAGLDKGIDFLFKDKINCVKLSTIHKSKGLEADTVWWLERDACPAKWARQPHQKQEEIHLCYVAATRAKYVLNLIEMQASEA